MVEGAEFFWEFLSIFCMPKNQQKEVIECWFHKMKSQYIPTDKITVISVFSASIIFIECWVENFGHTRPLVEAFEKKLRAIEGSYLDIDICLESNEWESLCSTAREILESADMEPDYSITCINYLNFIEIWTDDENNIIGINV